MREAQCPGCGSAEMEAERQVEERGGVFGLKYDDGRLRAEVDWSEKYPFGSVSYRCLNCGQQVFDLHKLIPKDEGAQ